MKPQRHDAMQAALALLLVIAFLLAGLALFRWAVPADNRELLTYMLGQLSGMVTTALAFYFATTKSSSDKNRALADAVQNVASGELEVRSQPRPADEYPVPGFGKEP